MPTRPDAPKRVHIPAARETVDVSRVKGDYKSGIVTELDPSLIDQEASQTVGHPTEGFVEFMKQGGRIFITEGSGRLFVQPKYYNIKFPPVALLYDRVVN